MKLLDSNAVEYLLIGGYGVAIHGHVRATNDLDIWVNMGPANAVRIGQALCESGFGAASACAELFLTPGNVIRAGLAKDIADLESLPDASGSQCQA